MDASLITIIINCLLALFVVYGFLWGLGRGAKKSLVRLIYFVGFVILFALFAQLIAKAVLNLPIISGVSPQDYINQYITDFINSNAEFSSFYANSESMQSLVANLPLMIVGLVIFIVLVILAKFFSYIGYRITCAIHFKKQKNSKDKIYTVKDGKPVIIAVPKEKKHRLIGGAIGAVQGLIILFALLLPITGVVRTVGAFVDTNVQTTPAVEESTPSPSGMYTNVSIANTETLNFESTTSPETKKEPNCEFPEIAKYLNAQDIIPPEIAQIFGAYNNSIFNKIFSLGDFDVKCFDAISTLKIEGQNTNIRKELFAFAEVAESAAYVYRVYEEIDPEAEISWKDLDYDKIKKAVNSLFDSGLIKTIGMEALEYLLNEIDVIDEIKDTGFDDQIKAVLNDIKTSLGDFDAETAATLKSDVLAVIGVAEAISKSGLLDVITTEINKDEIIDTIFEKLTSNDHDYIKDIYISILSSNTLRTALSSSLNEAIGIAETELNKIYLEQELNKDNTFTLTTSNRIVLDRIDKSKNSLWYGLGNDLTLITKNAYKIYKFSAVVDSQPAGQSDLEFIKLIISEPSESMPYNIFNIVDATAEIFDKIKGSAFFKSSNTIGKQNIFNQAMDAANKFDFINEYIDAEPLKTLNFKTEFAKLNNLINFAKPIILSDDYINFEYKNLDFNRTTGSKTDKSLKSILTSFIESDFCKAIKTKALSERIKIINSTTNASETIYDAYMLEIAEIIYHEADSDKGITLVDSVDDLKVEIEPIINIVCDLGSKGLIDFILQEKYETEADLNAFIKDLTTKINGVNSINIVVNNVINSSFSKLGVKYGFNEYFLPTLKDVDLIDENATFNTEYNSTAWTDLKTKVNSFVDNLITFYYSFEVKDINGNITQTPLEVFDSNDALKSILKNLVKYNDTTLNPNSNIILLGKSFDALISLEIFNIEKVVIQPPETPTEPPVITTEDINVIENILNNILTSTNDDVVMLNEMIGEFIDINIILNAFFPEEAEDQITNLFETEFTKVAPALNIMTTTNITKLVGTENKTYNLLEILIENGNLGIDEFKLLSGKTDALLDSLFSSELFAPLSVFVVNGANEAFLSLLTSSAIEPINLTYTELFEQKEDIKTVIRAGLDLITAKDSGNNPIDFGELKTVFLNFDGEIKAFLEALQVSSGELVIGDTTITKCFDTAFNTLVNTISDTLKDMVYKEIIKMVGGTPDETKTISYTELISQWDEIIDVLQTGDLVISSLETTTLDAVLNNPSDNTDIIDQIQELLIALENNSDEIGTNTPKTYEYFYECYVAVTQYIGDKIDTKLNTVVASVGGTYTLGNITASQIMEQWDSIIAILGKAKPFTTSFDIENVIKSTDENLTTANPTSLQNLLNELALNKTNNPTSSIFGTTYDAIQNVLRTRINDIGTKFADLDVAVENPIVEATTIIDLTANVNVLKAFIPFKTYSGNIEGLFDAANIGNTRTLLTALKSQGSDGLFASLYSAVCDKIKTIDETLTADNYEIDWSTYSLPTI